MELENILNSIDEDVANVPAIKRFIKKAQKGFRPKSPNDVDHYTYLASALYIGGDYEAAFNLFHFIDMNTEDIADGWADLAGSLAQARLIFAHFLKEQGENTLAKEILSRDRLEHSCDLNSQRDVGGLSKVQKEIKYLAENFEFNENHEETKHSHILSWAYESMLCLIVYLERFAELESRSDKGDKLLLETEIARYKDKFNYYLVKKTKL